MISYRISVIQGYLLANMRRLCPFAFIDASNVCWLRNAVLHVSTNRVCESIPQISAGRGGKRLCASGANRRNDVARAVIIRSHSAEPGSQCWGKWLSLCSGGPPRERGGRSAETIHFPMIAAFAAAFPPRGEVQPARSARAASRFFFRREWMPLVLQGGHLAAATRAETSVVVADGRRAFCFPPAITYVPRNCARPFKGVALRNAAEAQTAVCY